MALGWNTLQAIPRLLTYEAAAKREAETKPIRGREPEVKPLGRRNQAYHNIRREENGDIVACAYNNPVVRYRPDGHVVIYDSASWTKASHNEIIEELTGLQVWTSDNKAWVRCSGETNYLRPGHPRVYVPNRGWVDNPDPMPDNIFRYEAGNWVYLNPPARVVHNIRRKEMARVMQGYAAFVAYAKAMDSLREHKATAPYEYAELFDVKSSSAWNGKKWYHWYSDGMPPAVGHHTFNHAKAAELCALMRSTDATDNLKAFMWLKIDTHRPPAYVAKHVVIMHHHAEVLKTVERSGATKDRYRWAIPLDISN